MVNESGKAHPGSENLKPFKPGKEWNGNAKGRPKGSRNRSTIVREWLEAEATDGAGGQIADQLVRALIQKAMQGDVSAFKELMDSGFGKITDKIENTHMVAPAALSNYPCSLLSGPVNFARRHGMNSILTLNNGLSRQSA